MDVGMLVSFKLVVTTKEFGLLSRGLRGTLREDEKGEALALQEKMMLARANESENYAAEADLARENIERSKGGA
jgi:hypothetical protein